MILIELIILGFLIAYLMDRLFIVEDIYKQIVYLFFKCFGIKVDKNKITVIKPFSCSFCMTFWLTLCYVSLYSNFGFIYLILISLVNATLIKNYLQLYDILSVLLTRWLNYIENKLKNI